MALAETEFGSFYYFEPDEIGKKIAEGKFWDSCYRPWMDALPPASVVVDIGANIGFFTIYLAKRGHWIWSFEASSEVYSLLKRNIELNVMEINVRPINVALYDKETLLGLNPEWNDWKKLPNGKVDYENNSNSGGMSLVPQTISWNGTPQDYLMKAYTLDSFEVPHVRLIKIDTQGADLRILHGAVKTIEKYRPIVCFEIEPIPAKLHGDSIEDAYKFFQDRDYTVTCVNAGEYGQVDLVAVPNG